MARHQKRNISNLLERNRSMEMRFGVEFTALYCELEGPDRDGNFRYVVNGEFRSTQGDVLGQDIDVVVAFYNEEGLVVGNDSTFIMEDNFFQFETFSTSGYLSTDELGKIRVYPKAG